MERGDQLTDSDRKFYARHRWEEHEERSVETLDRYLLSERRAIKFVDRARLFSDESQWGAEEAVGKWLAWKDHQVRSAADRGMRGPGLGILCLRTTETDNEIRLWSTIADALSASPAWWDRFQWASVDQAVGLLAQLLCNFRADPFICSTSAPDLVVLFDEGDLTQRRTNPIFPDDFRGQLLDLLNPTKNGPNAVHHLNDALIEAGGGITAHTRIIVIYGAPNLPEAELPAFLDADDRGALERLAVFRFDFSEQLAYALLNYDRPPEGRMAWREVDARLRGLRAKGAVLAARERFLIPRKFLSTLRRGAPYSDPEAHLRAAKSLAPILEPGSLFISSNRDRTLEPENVLEATWHLNRARAVSSPRDLRIWPKCLNALTTLTFLRSFPDWDTVKQLNTTEFLEDGIELGRELLAKERVITGRKPHSSRVALLLNAIGNFGASLNGPSAEGRLLKLADEAAALFSDVARTLETLSARDARRQRRKLFSDYAYCMKRLGVPDNAANLSGVHHYLNDTIAEILSPEFYDIQDLDDYPVAGDWLKTLWNDSHLPPRERSTYAFVAARLYIGRWDKGIQVREPWDLPWIEYFALTTPEDFDAAQLHSPLMTWDSVYGHDRESSQQFGQRVRDRASYLSPRDTQELSRWGAQIRTAGDNLWSFVTHADVAKRLRVREAGIALHLIAEVAMREMLPA
jgi:hypothetical protein